MTWDGGDESRIRALEVERDRLAAENSWLLERIEQKNDRLKGENERLEQVSVALGNTVETIAQHRGHDGELSSAAFLARGTLDRLAALAGSVSDNPKNKNNEGTST